MESSGIFGWRFLVLLLVSAALHVVAMDAPRRHSARSDIAGIVDAGLRHQRARRHSNRLFIVEQGGRSRFLPPARHADRVSRYHVKSALRGERGLLGLAFHPQFGIGTNSRFFVNYTRQGDGATVIAEYHVRRIPTSPTRARSFIWSSRSRLPTTTAA
jgi:hypothetical protein